MDRKKPKWPYFLLGDLLLAAVAVGLIFAGGLDRNREIHGRKDTAGTREEEMTQASEAAGEELTEAATPTADAVPEAFFPHSTDTTDPSRLITTTEIIENDAVLSDGTFEPWYDISFGDPAEYTDVDGIVTFRGDPFRSSPVYGTASLKEYAIEGVWSAQTGGLTYQNASWSGSGWTGQPLIERWPKSVRTHMNMYDWAREKDELVEVIYACMDGYVYFLDLESGEPTRDSLYLGWTFKGAGALDPRGYPILYLGAGYDSNEGTSRAFIINLLDCSVMYTFGNDDPWSWRGHLSFFDASALVDAASDTLIYPGENGLLYLIHLGTQYDAQAGTLSINPDRFVRWRYNGVRSDASSFWLGMEDSPAIYDGYLFIADNGANLMCLDLNTLKLVWVQDILDDSNSTPVLSVEHGKLYLYVSTSFHLGWRSTTSATVPIWKIDAQTGEIVWQTDYECYSEEGVSGGVQSTVALGQNNLSDFIYVTVSRTGEMNDGVLTCLSKRTGQVMWEHKAVYAWSSPVCVYNEDGSGVVLYCTCGGRMYMLDGYTGEELSTFDLSDGAIEASPAIYNNRVVIGTRACKIWGLELK